MGALTGGEDQPLKVSIEAARAVDSPVVEGSITFTGGKATIVPSVVGRTVNVPETIDEIASRWPGQQAVQSVMTITQPKVSPGEIDRAAKEFAVPAMSAPVRLLVGQTTVTLQPAQYASALSLVADGVGVLTPNIDAVTLLSAVRASDPNVEHPRSIDGGGEQRSTRLVLCPRSGEAQPVPTRTASIAMVSTVPKVTTAMAQGWGIKELISTFTTQFPFNPPRTNNTITAVDALNGTLPGPGQRFSLNGTPGERTPAKGVQRARCFKTAVARRSTGAAGSLSPRLFLPSPLLGGPPHTHSPPPVYPRVPPRLPTPPCPPQMDPRLGITNRDSNLC